MNRFVLLFAAVVMLFLGCECKAQLLARPVAIKWNAQSAFESAQTFVNCYQSGGNRYMCLAQAGFQYWACSGSSLQTSFVRGTRFRAAIVGRRAIRNY
jgi:hypothetical protein